MVGRYQVASFNFRNRRQVICPGFGKQPARALLVEPFELPPPDQEDAAQHQFGHPARMRLRIRQRQRRTPAATEDLPAFDVQELPQRLDIRDKVPRGVVDQVGVRRRPPCPALVEKYDAVARRIMEAAHARAAARAGAAVEDDHRLAGRVAALLVMNPVSIIDRQHAGVVRSLIDPPQLPEKPYSPNRPAILLLGMILSLGGGVAYAGVLESMDSSIKSSKMLAGLLKAPLLSVIPYMQNSEDRRKKTKLKTSLVIGVIAGIALIALSIQFLWVPLDVLWYMILRKLDIWLG